jgi:hypothetical protein
MPPPVDAKVIFLGGIFLILFLAALYAVADIVWPLVLAFVLSLLLKPPMRLLARLRVPRVLCAVLLVVAVLGLVVGLGTAISGPAAGWAAKLPEGLPRLFQRLLSVFWRTSSGRIFCPAASPFTRGSGQRHSIILAKKPSQKPDRTQPEPSFQLSKVTVVTACPFLPSARQRDRF